MAGQKSPAVIMANERVKQAVERLNQTRSTMFPQVSTTLSETRKTENLETFGFKTAVGAPSVTGPFNVFDARVKLTQVLFDPSVIKRLEAAGIAQDVSTAEARKVKEDILAMTASFYIEARRAESEFQFSKVVLWLSREKFRLAETYLKLGTGSDLDLKNARTELSDARSRWHASKSKLLRSQLDLKAALGLPENQNLSFPGEAVSLRSIFPTRDEILRSSGRHPEVELAEQKLRETKALEASEKAEYLPKLSGKADYGASADQPSRSEATYSYGLEASWDLFDGGERNARVAESQSKSREAQVNLDDTSNQKQISALDAKESLKDARKMMKAKEDNLAAYKQQLDLLTHRFENGSASQMDLIVAMVQEAQAADEREETLAMYQTAQVYFVHSLGQMEKLSESLEKK